MCSILTISSPRQLCYVTHRCVPFFSKTTLLCHSRMCSIQTKPSPRQLCYVTQICVPFKPILLQDNFVMSLKYVFHSNHFFSKTTLLCHSNMCSIQANPSPRQLCYVTQGCVPFKPILLQDNFVMSLKDVFHSSQSFSKTTLLCHSNMCSILTISSPRQLCYVTQICVPFKPILLHSTLLCHSNMCSILTIS